MSSCLVLVDDDPQLLGALAFAFEREGAGVVKAESAARAEELAGPDVDLFIVGLEGTAAASLVAAIRAKGGAMPGAVHRQRCRPERRDGRWRN